MRLLLGVQEQRLMAMWLALMVDGARIGGHSRTSLQHLLRIAASGGFRPVLGVALGRELSAFNFIGRSRVQWQLQSLHGSEPQCGL